MKTVLACFLTLAALVAAEDWSQWRGPNRDGYAGPAGLPAKLPGQLAAPVWKVTVGEGHSSPVAAGGRVYSFARRGDNEVVTCHSLVDGKPVWVESYPAPYTVNPAAARHGPGPKSTPVVQGGAIYTLGISGILSSFDASTGKLRWRKQFSDQYPSTSPLFGTASSPLVVGDVLIAAVGGHDKGALIALQASSGAVKWKWEGDGPAYASPILLTAGGSQQVVTQSRNNVIAVALDSGRLLWKIPIRTSYDQNAVTPLAFGDLLIYSGLANGISAVRLVNKDGAWTTEKVWHIDELSLYMNSPVLSGNLLFGFSHKNSGQYFCVDARTGKTLWVGPPRGGDNAAIVRVGDALLLLNNEAELSIVKASGDGFQVIRKYTVADSPTWAHPVLVGGDLLIKDANTLRRLRLGS